MLDEVINLIDERCLLLLAIYIFRVRNPFNYFVSFLWELEITHEWIEVSRAYILIRV